MNATICPARKEEVMLYMVTTRIHRALIPEDQATDLMAKERTYAGELVKQKKILSAYRKAGGGGSFFLVDAESNEEIHKMFSGLPLAKYLEFDVIPIVLHPLFGGPA